MTQHALFLLPIAGLFGCVQTRDQTETPEEDPLPDFVDDCSSAQNETLQGASGLIAEDGKRYEDVSLCEDDIDTYRIDVPAFTWLSMEIFIDGKGKNKTDLDLWEIDDPTAPVDSRMDLVDDEAEENTIWYSAVEQPNESLAWYNDSDLVQTHFVQVVGYEGASADYDIEIRTSPFEEAQNCDDVEEDTSESGPCNQILLFPQANRVDQGYLVSHSTHYSHLRREVIYLVRYAAAETVATFGDTNPLGLLDMSQADGDTPGRMDDQLRHPEGTHIEGNDIDIAYYQTGEDNLGRSVCDNDGYYCTSAPDILDARRSAFFIAKLMESPYLRVIGVDTMIATQLKDAAQDLRDEGLLRYRDVQRMDTYLAYGSGWPFHQHHMHFSWAWESGWEGESSEPGCLVGNTPQYGMPTRR